MIGLPEAVNPRGQADTRPWCIAQLLAVNTGTKRAQVSIAGGAAVWLPYVAGTYTSITTVAVLLDPYRTGAGQLVLGPVGVQTDVPPAPNDPSTGPATTATVVIRPTWSRTWRPAFSNYSGWNASRYGGLTALWQGNQYGSGTLTGIAVYGNQIVNLHAASITAVAVMTPLAYGSGTVTLQGTSQGAATGSAPSPSGTSTSGAGGSRIALPSDVREALRTGAAKGLVLNGSAYLSLWGTARADGMALSITYTRPA